MDATIKGMMFAIICSLVACDSDERIGLLDGSWISSCKENQSLGAYFQVSQEYTDGSIVESIEFYSDAQCTVLDASAKQAYDVFQIETPVTYEYGNTDTTLNGSLAREVIYSFPSGKTEQFLYRIDESGLYRSQCSIVEWPGVVLPPVSAPPCPYWELTVDPEFLPVP